MKLFSVITVGKWFNQISNRSLSISSAVNNAKVAVVLSGCGVFDGTEIVEASSTMIHLSRHNADVQFFAPNVEQMHVVNHSTFELEPESRNVLTESARITRGNIKSLDKLKASEFQALIIPGGFGAAKNLCDYAINNSKLTVNPDLVRVVEEFSSGSKPIGSCCIAPVILGKLLPGLELTVGMTGKDWPYGGTVDSLNEMGVKTIQKDVTEIHTDKNLKVVTTPAFMKNASFYEVFIGIGKMVDEVLKLVK